MENETKQELLDAIELILINNKLSIDEKIDIIKKLNEML